MKYVFLYLVFLSLIFSGSFYVGRSAYYGVRPVLASVKEYFIDLVSRAKQLRLKWWEWVLLVALFLFFF